MKTSKLAGMVVATCLMLSGCHKKPKAPDGNELTSSGHEIPKPVDDSVIEKSDETPEQPNLK